ncbi:MAG TPA: hypothetical protein VGQ58_06095 [Candidatus Limnocylindrales bacterium]|jgi:hypothetical protein|nr:hypothetical protein [Candidatus Limnocylindrales bacterium]
MSTLSFRRRDRWYGQDRDYLPGRPRARRLVRTVMVFSLVALIATIAPIATRAAGVSVNLDQYATLDAAWQNGNLNGNNARFPEGGAVPYRLAIEGLKKGKHTIHINYDFTAGGHKAFDFLTTWNAWSKPSICAGGGGGISSMCPSLPAPTSFAMPPDPFSTNGLSVNVAEVFSGMPRRLTIWGGTIQSVSVPRHSGSTAGNSSADVTVSFTSTGSAVLLAWGGHLAQSRYWDVAAGGTRDGAGEVSGAPWHMRTLGLDGGGARNQDRSIQPSAIVGEIGPPAPPPPPAPAPPAPSGTATPRPPLPAPSGSGPRLTPPPTSTEALTGRSGDAGAINLVLLLAVWAGSVMAALRRARRPSRHVPIGRSEGGPE